MTGLWPTHEAGNFPTLGGNDPLNFEPIEPQAFRNVGEQELLD